MTELPPAVIAAWIAAVGLCVGSFLNVCIVRIPERRSVVFPSSACPSCGSLIRWYDNIPVVSYLLLHGRCRACSVRISPVYPLIELAGGAILLAQYGKAGASVELIRGTFFLSCLLVLFLIDLQHMILPDVITVPGAAVGLVFAGAGASPVSFLDSFAAAAAGALTLLIIMGVYYAVRRRQGMGMGDVKMLLTIGAFLGLKGTYLTLVAASLAGGIFSVGLLLAGRKLDYPIPFGCFLAVGAALAYYSGNAPLDWYLSLLR